LQYGVSHGILDIANGFDPKADEEVPLLRRREASQRSVETLVTKLQSEVAQERWEAAAALGDFDVPASAEALVSALSDAHPFVRWQAGQALGRVASRLRRKRSGPPLLRALRPEIELPSLVERLTDLAGGSDAHVRATAAEALGAMGVASGLPILRELLADEDATVRASAAAAVGKLRSERATGELVTLLEDDDRWARRAAVEALGRIGGAAAERALVAELGGTDVMLRASAAAALGHCSGSSVPRALIGSLSDECSLVRWQAAHALGSVGNITAVPHLEKMLEDGTLVFGVPVEDVARQAARTIKRRHRGLWNTLRRWISSIGVDKRRQV
jgi:HEAT repeat protein